MRYRAAYNGKLINCESGFTLIEVIASIVILGLMAMLAGMGIVMAARGYMVTKESAHMAQKAQLAMARINREIMEISQIAARADTPPDPYVIYDHIDERRAIAKDGKAIKMFFNLGAAQTSLPPLNQGDILIDSIEQLTLTYHKGNQPWVFGDDIRELSAIDVEIVMSRADSGVSDKIFVTTVRPRNTKN